MPTRVPGPTAGTSTCVCSTSLPALVKRQLINGTTVLALLLTMGTVGPAVIGTAASGTMLGRCTTTPSTRTAWPNGSNATSAGVGGPLCWPTLSGVQIWPVLGSRNSGTPGVAGTSRLLRGA